MRLWDEEWAWSAGKSPIVVIVVLVIIIIVVVSLLANLTVTAFEPIL
jgi:hypothetical protein